MTIVNLLVPLEAFWDKKQKFDTQNSWDFTIFSTRTDATEDFRAMFGNNVTIWIASGWRDMIPKLYSTTTMILTASGITSSTPWPA